MEPPLSCGNWRKSSWSGSSGGQCVEVALAGEVVAVRDSKNPGGPVLMLSPSTWDGFRAEIVAGRFDIHGTR
ncbi:DUF397 domain-containing protein [Gandjariella thermophila]|uniref:DUF397 domain-containing protein n=1 Tax=Gandjariella thermophila TaxID=1931992 RepID=A0A4D4JAE2_9PSEU|nr:DUF397 domain-containing protein [Gandjariella thermophila]GDY32292.1 hypothetical protein GTS_39250 [Gandjariella thermophila]